MSAAAGFHALGGDLFTWGFNLASAPAVRPPVDLKGVYRLQVL